jgi:hypothetical protein
MRNAYIFLVGKPKENIHAEDIGVGVGIILNVLKK